MGSWGGSRRPMSQKRDMGHPCSGVDVAFGGLIGEEVVEDLDVFFGFFVGGEVAAFFEDY
jgi:hypothetical protein